MALAPLDAVRKVCTLVRDSADRGDGALLARYRRERDTGAFSALVHRHGPMVLGVCRRVLRDSHAADDAFQATFLVLARKADQVRPPDRLAPWLYGVAYRTALKARGRAYRRQQVEQQYATEMANRAVAAPDEPSDLLPIIDEQLSALPEKYRAPLVLCGVQGLNKAEAAERLGLPEGTVSSRLARAREMLRDRLSRRGVVVPVAALGATLTADTLRAAVPPALCAAAATAATGSALVSPTVLALTTEVLRSMTLLKLKALSAVALVVALTGGGFGLYALSADEKKPAGEKPVGKPAPAEKPGEKPGTKPEAKPGEKPAKPDAEKPKPATPDGEKKPVKLPKAGGRVANVDAKEGTLTFVIKGDGGVVEKVVKVAQDAKVFVDGKEAKLADVPKNSTAALILAPGKEGEQPTATEVRITGSSFGGRIKEVNATSLTLADEKKPRTVTLAAGGTVTINGKEAKLTDLSPGDAIFVTLTADESSALLIASGKGVDGEKPGAKAPKFGGKIAAVDATARTVTLTGKGADTKILVQLSADAKVLIDGKEAKLADLPIGASAAFTLTSAKDGAVREANEVVVVGPTFGGAVKQLDATSITIGTEKADRVYKLLATTKVTINGKDAKAADLKVGDRVLVTLAADESGLVQITGGMKPGTGDKPKPEKE
jgi:RNA polymerase sigma factor (sigma-70 family)